MKTLTKTTLSATAIAAVAFFALPPNADAQSRFSKFRVQQSGNSSGNSSNSNSRLRVIPSTSNSNSSSSKKRPAKPSFSISKTPTLQVRPAVQPKPTYQKPAEKKPTYQVRPSSNPTPAVRPAYQPRPSTPAKPSVSIATKPKTPFVPSRPVVTRPSTPSKPAVSIPTRPATPSRPAATSGVVDVKKMISTLQGTRGLTKPSTSGISTKKTPADISKRPSLAATPKVVPSAPILDRTVAINPKALPKGMGTTTFMKKGNAPAVGVPDKLGTGGTATAYMKKGNGRAEGEATRGTPISVRIKEGRPQAESAPQPNYGNGGIAQNLSSGGATSSSPSTSGASGYQAPASSGYPAAPSISYKVDSTSQLSTDSVKFRKGSTELADAASYHYLQNLAAALRDPSLASERFVVEGHASAEGAETSNLILSQQRSNAIFDFMISQGIGADRLLSIGHGEYHARYTTSHPEYLRAQDRQVIVFKLAE